MQLRLLLLTLLLLSACGPSAASMASPSTTATMAAIESAPTVTSLIAPTASSTSGQTLAMSQATGQNGGIEIDFPLALGSTWTYQETRYEGVPITEILTATHVTTETIVDIKSIASYQIVEVHRDESAEMPIFAPPSRRDEPLRPAASSNYWWLVRGNDVFLQEGAPNLAKADEALLKYVFPLKAGAKWFQVGSALPREVIRLDSVVTPAGRFQNCFSLREEWAGATFLEWFCPKVGIVESSGDHHGTPFGGRKVLTSYHLAP